MKLTLEYTAQLASVTGVSEEAVVLDAGETLGHLLRRLAKCHGESFREMVFDNENQIRSTLLLSLDEVMVSGDKENVDLSNVSVLLLMMPVAGG